MNYEKDQQSFLWNLLSKIQEHFKNKSLKAHYFKDFLRTIYNSRTIQGIQEPLATLFIYCLYKNWTILSSCFTRLNKDTSVLLQVINIRTSQ